MGQPYVPDLGGFKFFAVPLKGLHRIGIRRHHIAGSDDRISLDHPAGTPWTARAEHPRTVYDR